MRIRKGVGASRALACAFVSLVLAACGSGGKTYPPFVQGQIIGTGGGSAQTDTVRLDVPSGAFAGDVAIAILPQPTPLPIDPNAGAIDYMPGIMCIGPIGLDLLVPAHVRLCYSPFDVPAGASEATDLVLLEYDAVAGYMRVSTTAVQDLVSHCFDDDVYGQLGHIAIGVLTRPAFDLVFLGSPVSALVAPQGLPAATPGLVLASTVPGGTPLAIEGTEGADRYIGSRDGSRILFSVPDFSSESTSLWTVDVGPVGPLPSREVLAAQTFNSSDGLYGWLGDQDRIFHERPAEDLGNSVLPPRFSAINGDGSGAPDDLTSRNTSTYLDDVRISPDRTKALLRWTEFGDGTFVYVDTVDLVAGTVIATDLPTSTDLSDPTPRWLPDSSGIYFVENDGTTVTRMDPDGGNAATIYDLTNLKLNRNVLVDFVLTSSFAGTAQRCAFIRRDLSLVPAALTGSGGPDYYATDLLEGGEYQETDLGGWVDVLEMVPATSDDFATSLILVQVTDRNPVFLRTAAMLPFAPDQHTLVFDGGGANGGAGFALDLPVPLSRVDLGRGPGVAGKMLIWIESPDPAYPEYPNPGIYLLDAFGGNPVDVTPAGWVVTAPPRWLQSWRFTPGFYDYSPRVR